jgi:hypothetical protein
VFSNRLIQSPGMQGDYADRLTAAMSAAGVSVPALAKELKISYQAVKKVVDRKSGAFSAENNEKAARFLGISSRWLALGDGDPGDALSPLAIDLGRMLDEIADETQRRKAYALCIQLLQAVAGPSAAAPTPPAPSPAPTKPPRSRR